MSKTKTAATPTATPDANGNLASRKTTCPVTRDQFRAKAPRAVTVSIGGQPVAATIKEFSTGSLGYYANGKIVLEIDGLPVTFQVGVNLTAVGSKELPQ